MTPGLEPDGALPPAIWDVPEQFQGIYAHAVEVPPATRLLFLSGQVGASPDGSIAAGFAAQCGVAMANVEALPSRAGASPAHLVKVTYLITHAGDVPELVEARRSRWIAPNPPAVTVMVVAALANPNFLIEIDAVAAIPDRRRNAPANDA